MSSINGYQKVANKKDLKEGDLLKVEPGGIPIVLAKVEGKIYAIDAVCTHEGGPLDEGELSGHNLTCPWHNAVFDVRNGKVSDQTVWATDLSSYPVQVDENAGDISLSLQKSSQAGEKAVAGDDKSKEVTDASERKYYEEQEKKTPDTSKLQLELLEKEKLERTDTMTFKLGRESPSSGSKSRLDFAAGQFSFFKLGGVSNDPKGPVRHFSIASSPTEEFILISTKIRDSPYKQKLASLDNGTKILAWGPEGDFTLHDDYSKPAVLLSGGIGVTPFRSMIKYATDKRLPLKITMFDSNRDKKNILYNPEFDQWAKQNKNLKIVYTITEEEQKGSDGAWAGERGRIDKGMITKHLRDNEIAKAVYYICGPPGMLKAMQKLLTEELQIPKSRIKIEEFTGY
jgi:ferredoxin-NADP reductase/nitrite reductase/ring-hydroxylating ferredoxin subunit